MSRRRPVAVCACALTLALAGCGISDPYDEPQQRKRPSPPAQAAEPGGAVQSLETFALLWTNWSREDLAENRLRLARLATGELRHQLVDEAHAAAAEPEPRGSGLENRGSVAGILLRGRLSALVVTRETVRSGPGAGQSSYAVYLARAVQTASGWRVAEWVATS